MSACRVGYLLPTREAVMAATPEVRPLLRLAEQAERLGYDSLWVGDSLVARPRHEPLTLLAAVAARTERALLGTAVLLPVLRHPVVLAHLVGTVDRISEGRLLLGVGIAGDAPSIRAEFANASVPFERRLGRMIESLELCRKLWTGESVTHHGEFYRVDDVTMGPTPHRPGGPPILGAGNAPGALHRAATRYDGWIPIGPNATRYREGWQAIGEQSSAAGRSPADLEAAVYLTLSVDDDAAQAHDRLVAFLEAYYPVPAAVMLRNQACFAGRADDAERWIAEFVSAGARHLVLRFAGEHERHLEIFAGLAGRLG